MPRDPIINAMLRDRVRADFQLPFAVALLAQPEFAEDTSEESLAAFRAAGVAPTAAAVARTTRDDSRRQAEDLLTRPGALMAVTTAVLVIGTNFSAAVVGPVPFSPAFLEAVTVNFNVAAAADGGTHGVAWAVLISSNTDLSIAGLQADQNVIVGSDAALNGIVLAQSRVSGFTGMNDFFPINLPIPIAPAFLKLVVNIAANVVFGGAVFHIRQAAAAILGGTQFIPVIPRINLNLNTAPTQTRGTTAPLPRAAAISVTQGGRILSERTVAWPSLTADIRRDWFNRQVGGAADPSIRWIL